MRIIAGHARGRRLVVPKGQSTRPTPDRVKESLFSMLAPELPGARVLDLFAGTGALGLEALSRGAASAVFVERDTKALLALRQNIAATRFATTRVLSVPAAQALALLAREHAQFELAFLDPPFDAGLLEPNLHALAELDLVLPLGVVVCEHSRDTEAPSAPAGYMRRETRGFGDVTLSLYDRKG